MYHIFLYNSCILANMLIQHSIVLYIMKVQVMIQKFIFLSTDSR